MSTSLLGSFLSPDEVVSRLEEAQCASPCSAGKILRDVAPRLMRVHPRITEAAMATLAIHPRETIPHLPDFISDSPQDTSIVLDSFSVLLRADRTLLVPIIATLPELALTSDHILHARSTMSFALSVVDGEDLPTVVRAFLRSTNNHSSAEWAARTVRLGLSRSVLKATLAPLLVHVLDDFLRSSSAVARALRAQAGAPFLELDLFVWVLSFSPRLASPLPSREARASLRAALDIGMLSHGARIREYVELAAPALSGIPDAVHRFALEVLGACPLRFSDVCGCFHLIHALIVACPAAWDLIVSDVSFESCNAAKLIICAILNLSDSAAQSRATPVEYYALICQKNENSDTASDNPAWNQLFIKVRKGLLFGQQGDQMPAIELAADIIQNAPRPVVREILSILHESVPSSLAGSTAIDLLALYKQAVLCGAVEKHFVESFFGSRIASQCPAGFYDEEPDLDAHSIGIQDAVAVKIDVGLIWNQAPTAAATVVSALVASLAFRRCIGDNQRFPFHALNVVVLVPVNCLSLYQAVDQINSTSGLTNWKSGRSKICGVAIEDVEIAEEVMELTDGDIAQAITAFGTGIAAIIGILNTACGSLDQCSRVLNRRSTEADDEQESADHKVNWALLERLTELHRMLNALTLGHGLLSKRGSSVISSSTHHRARRSGKKNAQKESSTSSLDAKLQSDAVVANINAVLFRSSDTVSCYNRRTNSAQQFPSLSLKSVIASIVAIPDESEMLTLEISRVTERDVELVEMDKFLLRLLLRSLLEVNISRCKRSSLVRNKKNIPSEDQFSGPLSVIARQAFREFDVDGEDNVHSLFKCLGDVLDEDKNIFFVSDDLDVSDDSEPHKALDACDLRWACGELPLEDVFMEYLTDGISGWSKRRLPGVHSAALLHSPAFAALLLDRAATAATVSRNARKQAVSHESLKDLISVSGMALSCLGHILRNLPSYLEQHLASNSRNELGTGHNSWENIRQFVESMNNNILTHLPKDFSNDERHFIPQGEDVSRFLRVFETLEWIRVTTIDSTVAMRAAEMMMVFSELDVCSSVDARCVVFLSLSTIYEFDNGSMWNAEDLSMVIKDPFHDWLLRRRGRVNLSNVGNLYASFDCGESPPWVELKRRPGKSNTIEHLRLIMYFCGMHVTSAVEEGCGWVREFSQVITTHTREARCSMYKDKPASNNALNSGTFTILVQAQRFQICDILLDMIGLRTIILTLMDLVNYGLAVYSVDETLLPSEAHDQFKSPLYTINMCIRLLSGIQALYFQNRQVLVSMPCGQNAKIDEVLEKEVINGSITALQKVHRRIEELHQWYSNEIVQVCDLVPESVELLHQIVGGAIVSVTSCVQFAESLRSTQTNNEADSKGLNTRDKRKVPGYVKHKRGKSYSDTRRFSDFSRGWKLIPRLANICEQIRKSAEQFARSLGVKNKTKLSSLAAKSIFSDENFHFGIGINGAGAAPAHDESIDFNDSADGDKIEAGDTGVETGSTGFRAHGVDEDKSARTISVRFRHNHVSDHFEDGRVIR